MFSEELVLDKQMNLASFQLPPLLLWRCRSKSHDFAALFKSEPTVCGFSMLSHQAVLELQVKSSSGSWQVRQQIEAQVAQKSTELEQYLQRVQELEDMYRRLEDALEEERHARQDEEAVRRLQAR